MNEFPILIVDDESQWRELLHRALLTLGDLVRVHLAQDYMEALALIRAQSFYLAIVDLRLGSIPSTMPTIQRGDELGFHLVKDLRASTMNQECSYLILTAYPTSERARVAFKDLGVYDFLTKEDFDRAQFLTNVCAALFDALLKRARKRRERLHLLSFTFHKHALVSIEIRGPNHYQNHYFTNSPRLDLKKFAHKCDEISTLLAHAPNSRQHESWRQEAHSIGVSLYSRLTRVREVSAALGMRRLWTEKFSELSLHFNGPGSYVAVPFELLIDSDEDYLTLHHPLHRRVFRQSMVWSRKVDAFHTFIVKLRNDHHELRVLLIAANTGTFLPAVDREIKDLYKSLSAILRLLGLAHQIDICLSKEATYQHVETLLNKKNYHIIHYAGHGVYNEVKAEQSGLIFLDQNRQRVMQADALKALLQDSSVRFVYLNCCLGARIALRSGIPIEQAHTHSARHLKNLSQSENWENLNPSNHSDFLGIMDAIVQADVPAVLGYRWPVADEDAELFAREFYDALFTTFSFDDAILQARNALVRAEGRQNETWASPVLVLQNP